MDVRHLSTEVWDSLQSQGTSTPRNAPAQVLTFGSADEPFSCVFMSVDGSAHLLIAAQDDLEVPQTRSLRGLDWQVLRNHAVVGRERQAYLDLRCTATTFLLPFTRVAQDVATLALRDQIDPGEALIQVADAWRAFWAPFDRPVLSETEQRGLIGELLVLDALAAAGVAGATAWSGPDDDRHDFRTARVALEVKTCLGSPRRHTINSLEQLAPTGNLPLFLASVVLEAAEGGSISLPGVVDRLTTRFAGVEAVTFRERLSSTGYTPAHAEYYRNQYLLGEIRGYAIDQSFPRITRDSFTVPPPASVERVTYVVNLENCPYLSFEDLMRAASIQ